MLRFYYKQKKITQTLKALIYIYQMFYKKTWFYKNNKFFYNTYNYNLTLVHPKRQQFLCIYNFYKNKFFSYSVGLILKEKLLELKFYKRSMQNTASLIMFVKKTIFRNKKKIYFIHIKNFTYKQYLFLCKFYQLIRPQINVISISKSYYLKKKYKRRLKRNIWQTLRRQ